MYGIARDLAFEHRSFHGSIKLITLASAACNSGSLLITKCDVGFNSKLILNLNA